MSDMKLPSAIGLALVLLLMICIGTFFGFNRYVYYPKRQTIALERIADALERREK